MEVKVNTTILIDGLEETPLNELSTDSNEKNIEEIKKAKVKYSSLRCTETTKNKINALVSTNDFENIEDCLKHMLAAYEATMSNEKIQEYEIIQKILERKSNK
ncbi:hypothetical protein ACWOEY_11280 [Enterococcus sulfureus]